MKSIYGIVLIGILACNNLNNNAEKNVLQPATSITTETTDNISDTLTIEEKDSIAKVRLEYSLHHSMSGDASEAYDMLHVVFEGMPDVEKIKPLIEAVMKKYDVVINNDNVQRVGSMLLSLKKSSAIGVTEMDILQHIYQNGTSAVKLPEQAAISATLLEMGQ